MLEILDAYTEPLRSFMAADFYATRKAMDLTQMEMADILDIDPRSYSCLEHGESLCSTRVFLRYILKRLYKTAGKFDRRCTPYFGNYFADDFKALREKEEPFQASSSIALLLASFMNRLARNPLRFAKSAITRRFPLGAITSIRPYRAGRFIPGPKQTPGPLTALQHWWC